MQEQARELAARGHQAGMIVAMLKANGFPEASEWMNQPHVQRIERYCRESTEASGRSGDGASGLNGIVPYAPEAPLKWRQAVY